MKDQQTLPGIAEKHFRICPQTKARRPGVLLALCALGMVAAASVQAQPPSAGVFVPPSNLHNPLEPGLRFHTRYLIGLVTGSGLGPVGGMTPAQIRSFYNMPSTGGSGVIAIVDAYHYSTALNDFNVFSAQFGLPQETSTDPLSPSNKVFQVVYASGSPPRKDPFWSTEAALDIQWAHAMAPNAKIVLVEAEDNGLALLDAVDVASALPGVKEVTMSWGATEEAYLAEGVSPTEADAHFPLNNGIVYFAATGDAAGVPIYPSTSPNVVSCGGTSVQTDSAGNFVSETGWGWPNGMGSGGGLSICEPRPEYQDVIADLVGSMRGTPDISSDSDPYTGVCIYITSPYSGGQMGHQHGDWLLMGGTSLATPCIAGMVNVAGSYRPDSAAELEHIYGDLGRKWFRDITFGTAGSFSCLPGWDFITGVGSPWGTKGL